MHLLDLGITKYLLEFTRIYLQQKVGMEAIKQMDLQLSGIPRYPELIIIKNSLENVFRFTTNDYQNSMKIIIFIMDNLYVEYWEDGISCERLCSVFYKYLKMYMILWQESFTDVDLQELEVIIAHSLLRLQYFTYNLNFLEIDN